MAHACNFIGTTHVRMPPEVRASAGRHRIASHRTTSPVETADAVTCGAIATRTVTVITRLLNGVIACRAATGVRRLPRNASVLLEVEAISG